jgi:hypothetical protein
MTLAEKFDELWRVAIMDQPRAERSDEAKRKCFGLWLSGVAEAYVRISEAEGPDDFVDRMWAIREEINTLRDGLNTSLGRN